MDVRERARERCCIEEGGKREMLKEWSKRERDTGEN